MSDLNLKKLLTPKTSAEAHDNIAIVEAGLEETHVEVETARNQRETALLSGTDAAVTKATEHLRAAELQFERLKLTHEKLSERIPGMVEEEEHQTAVDKVAAAREAMRKGLELTDQYIAQAQQVADTLKALNDCYEAVGLGLRLGQEHGLSTDGLVFPHKTYDRREVAEEAWTETAEPYRDRRGEMRPGHVIEHEAVIHEWRGINLVDAGIYLPGLRHGEPAIVRQGGK